MDHDSEFAGHSPPSFQRTGNVAGDTEVNGFNPGLIVLLLVGSLLLIFLVGNYFLYSYAQKSLPPRKKKPVSKKKIKRRDSSKVSQSRESNKLGAKSIPISLAVLQTNLLT